MSDEPDDVVDDAGMPPIDENLRSTKEVGNWMNTKGSLERWEHVHRYIDDIFMKSAQKLTQVHEQGVEASQRVHEQAIATGQRAFELSQKCFGNMHERVSGLDMNEAQARRINAGTTLGQTALDQSFVQGMAAEISQSVATAIAGQLRAMIELLSRPPAPAAPGASGAPGGTPGTKSGDD